MTCCLISQTLYTTCLKLTLSSPQPHHHLDRITSTEELPKHQLLLPNTSAHTGRRPQWLLPQFHCGFRDRFTNDLARSNQFVSRTPMPTTRPRVTDTISPGATHGGKLAASSALGLCLPPPPNATALRASPPQCYALKGVCPPRIHCVDPNAQRV